MRYDGASAAAAKSKKVQPSSTLKKGEPEKPLYGV
jgi:hypothetical protein